MSEDCGTNGSLTRERRIDRLFAAYDVHHCNATNKAVHWIAVPAIMWSVFALLVAAPAPAAIRAIPGLDWGMLAAIAASAYYLFLSRPLGLGMAVFCIASVLIAQSLRATTAIPLWQIALAVFVVGWIAQFIGHKIEGAKPKFLDDVRFLIVGPAWVGAELYRALGIKY